MVKSCQKHMNPKKGRSVFLVVLVSLLNLYFRPKLKKRADYGRELCGGKIQNQTSFLAKATAGWFLIQHQTCKFLMVCFFQ